MTNFSLPSPKRFIQQKMQRFFANRVPQSDEVDLGIRNIYVFLSREGGFFVMLLVITFIAGINYGNNLVLGLCFYLASIWLISVYVSFSHVSGLTVRLLDVSMAEAGKPAWANVEIVNKASKPSRQLNVRFDHTAYNEENHLQVPPSAISRQLASVEGTQTLRLPIMTSKRGELKLPRLIISTVYPLGVIRAWSYAYFKSPAWVYPKPIGFEWDAQKALASDDESDYSQYQAKGQNDFDMLDEYQKGESLSRVSWAHVARGHGMLTKHFADSVGREMKVDYADMPASHHEQKLGQLAYAVQALAKEGQSFILNLPNEQGQLGAGNEFVKASLLRLAKAP